MVLIETIDGKSERFKMNNLEVKDNLITFALETTNPHEDKERFNRTIHLDNLAFYSKSTGICSSSSVVCEARPIMRISLKNGHKFEIKDFEEVFINKPFMTVISVDSETDIPMKNISYYDIITE